MAVACGWCKEPIMPGDRGTVQPFLHRGTDPTAYYQHLECMLRQTFGSVGHQRRQCHCYGGELEDPPELSVRQAARAACEEAGLGGILWHVTPNESTE